MVSKRFPSRFRAISEWFPSGFRVVLACSKPVRRLVRGIVPGFWAVRRVVWRFVRGFVPGFWALKAVWRVVGPGSCPANFVRSKLSGGLCAGLSGGGCPGPTGVCAEPPRSIPFCAVPRYKPRHIAVADLVTHPTQPSFSNPLSTVAWLALRSCKFRAAAGASLHASMHSRYRPRCRPNLSPGRRPPFCVAWLALIVAFFELELHIALLILVKRTPVIYLRNRFVLRRAMHTLVYLHVYRI